MADPDSQQSQRPRPETAGESGMRLNESDLGGVSARGTRERSSKLALQGVLKRHLVVAAVLPAAELVDCIALVGLRRLALRCTHGITWPTEPGRHQALLRIGRIPVTDRLGRFIHRAKYRPRHLVRGARLFSQPRGAVRVLIAQAGGE